MLDIYLISMPYASVERPSLALGILKASLINHGISANVCYANIAFAEQIGLRNYFFFSNSFPAILMGEWIFSGAAFPDFTPDQTKYLQECNKRAVSAKFLWKIRNMSSAFIDQLARQILAEHPKIVGCSSMFQQHCASLAILRRIKTLRPEVITMLGGANCEGSMGQATHQHFEWIDYVVSGDAELILPELCQQILRDGRDIPQENIPEGVYSPSLRTRTGNSQPVSRVLIHDLNTVPIPMYDDYFETLKASTIADQVKPGLVFETSRGCWWGQKKHCIFCGVNGSRMTFRSKSPERILNEMEVLSQTYGLKKLLGTDSILDMSHFKTVFPKLAEANHKYYLQFETSANLTRKQIQLLSEAGVFWINPGIESLHDNLLLLLRKGTNAWKNVQLLKWCMQYGIFVSWAFLVNIPGDSTEWYREMIEWLPLIYHLQAPIKQVYLHYDRFSPCYQHPDQFHLKLEPSWLYSQIYPLTSEQLADLAYYFDDVALENKQELQKKLPVLMTSQTLIDTWQELFYTPRKDIVKKEVAENRPRLNMEERGDQLLIRDTRPCAVEATIMLEGLAREIYTLCDVALTPDMLVKHLHKKKTKPVSWNDIQPIVEQLCAQKILLRLHDRLLSLAVRTPYPKMLTHDEYPGGLVMIPRTKK